MVSKKLVFIRLKDSVLDTFFGQELTQETNHQQSGAVRIVVKIR